MGISKYFTKQRLRLFAQKKPSRPDLACSLQAHRKTLLRKQMGGATRRNARSPYVYVFGHLIMILAATKFTLLKTVVAAMGEPSLARNRTLSSGVHSRILGLESFRLPINTIHCVSIRGHLGVSFSSLLVA